MCEKYELECYITVYHCSLCLFLLLTVTCHEHHLGALAGHPFLALALPFVPLIIYISCDFSWRHLRLFSSSPPLQLLSDSCYRLLSRQSSERGARARVCDFALSIV